jgi:RNA polymerase sigma-70 factor, ECF subfamily
MTAITEQPPLHAEPNPEQNGMPYDRANSLPGLSIPNATTPTDGFDLATLVRKHQAGVWRYVRFLGADASEADDLTQETFLALARAYFVERDEQQTAGYLRVVARNQLLALRRKQNREVGTVELEAAESVWATAAGPDASLSMYLDALRDCLAAVEGRARQAIDLQYAEEASRETIASRLGMQPDGVKTLLRRTRHVLRECVERKIKIESTS